jgi:transposase
MFVMGKDLTEVVRNRAVGMVEGGLSISEVAKTMKVNRATVWRWMKTVKAGRSLAIAKGRGRKSSLTKMHTITTHSIRTVIQSVNTESHTTTYSQHRILYR